MSSPYSSALASRSSLIFFLFWLPRLLFSVFTQGCCWCKQTDYEILPQPKAHAMSRVRGAASAQPTPCFSSFFGFAAAIFCGYRSMLSVYTRPRKAQSVRPMIEYEMPPQSRAHAMSRARGTALAKPTPCFSSYFGCAVAIPRVQRDAPGRGNYDMSIAYGAADAPRTPGFSSYFALLHDEA